MLRLTLFAIFELWLVVSSAVLKAPPERKGVLSMINLEVWVNQCCVKDDGRSIAIAVQAEVANRLLVLV